MDEPMLKNGPPPTVTGGALIDKTECEVILELIKAAWQNGAIRGRDGADKVNALEDKLKEAMK